MGAEGGGEGERKGRGGFANIQTYVSGFTTVINNPKSQWLTKTNIHFLQNFGVL